MKNRTYIIILIFSILITCNSYNYFNARNFWIVNLEIEGGVNEIDKTIKNLRECDLPALEIMRANDTIINLTFESKFDSEILSKIFKDINIKFQEAFYFHRLDENFDTILLELGKFESRMAWRINKNDAKSSNDNTLNSLLQYQRGSHIGVFLVKDTSEINKFLYKSNIQEKLPPNLVFTWSKLLSPDSLSLYMLKANSIKKGLSEVNITKISTAIRERYYHPEYDKSIKPNNLDSELYYEISFSFDSDGATELDEFTRKNVGREIVMKFNKTNLFVAQVSGTIEGGRMSYTFPAKEVMIRFYMLILFDDMDGLVKVNRFVIQ